MNYTKISSTNPLKKWQTIVAGDLQIYSKPIYVLAGFSVFPLRIFWQTNTATGDRLIAFLIDKSGIHGKVLVFMTLDENNLIMEFHIKRNGYYCSELANLLVASLILRLKKGGKYNVFPPLLIYPKTA